MTQPDLGRYLNKNHLAWGKLIRRVCYLDALLFISETVLNQHLIYYEDLLQMSSLGTFAKSLDVLAIYSVNYFINENSSMGMKK